MNSGDIVAFLGPNGAGKTSTLKMILNLISPDKYVEIYQKGLADCKIKLNTFEK